MKRCKRSGEEATTSSLRLSLYWNSRTCHESRTRKNKKSQTRICRYYTTNNTVLRSIKNSIFLFLFPLFIPSAVAWLYGIAYWYTKRQGVGLCANICKLTVNNERSKDCNLKNKCHKITLIDLSCQIITTNIPFPSYMQHWCMGLMAKKCNTAILKINSHHFSTSSAPPAIRSHSPSRTVSNRLRPRGVPRTPLPPGTKSYSHTDNW